MKLSVIKQLIREEMSRLEFMRHLADRHPDLSARQVGEIYELYKGGMAVADAVQKVAAVNEAEEQTPLDASPGRLGMAGVSRGKQAAFAREKGKGIASGEELSGIDNRERAIMVDLEKIIAAIAEKDDLVKYRSALQAVVNKLRKAAGV